METVKRIILTFIFFMLFAISYAWFKSGSPVYGYEVTGNEGILIMGIAAPFMNITAIETTEIILKNPQNEIIYHETIDPSTYREFIFEKHLVGSFIYVRSKLAVIVGFDTPSIVVNHETNMYKEEWFFDDEKLNAERKLFFDSLPKEYDEVPEEPEKRLI